MVTSRHPHEKRRAPHPRELVNGIVITDFLTPRDFLNHLFLLTKEKSFGYSYLDFAQDLGFSRSNVVRLMIVGQRPLTLKSAERIAESLSLSGLDKKYFMILVKHGISRVTHERDELFKELVALKSKKNPKELNPSQAEYFSEWYHPVLREMTSLADFQGDPQWIQERLNFPLRIDQIKKSLDLLGKLGFIYLDKETGKWQKNTKNILTDDEVDSLALIRYHQSMIDRGKESIVQLTEDQRDIKAATLSVPSELLPLLKAKITSWLHEIVALEQNVRDEEEVQSSNPKDQNKSICTRYQVVQVNVQLFAFTKADHDGHGGAS
jgi:uncharacterized protein (TIGR02147 family)